jgi:hypothetical protein
MPVSRPLEAAALRQWLLNCQVVAVVARLRPSAEQPSPWADVAVLRKSAAEPWGPVSAASRSKQPVVPQLARSAAALEWRANRVPPFEAEACHARKAREEVQLPT